MTGSPTSIQILATFLFGLAVLHTFLVKRFALLSHRHPEGSVAANLLHFLAETELVFGLWATALVVGIAVVNRSVGDAVAQVEKLDFTEAKFVFVILVIAASRPVVRLAESVIGGIARLLPMRRPAAFYAAALGFGPLLGSFITEPAAMTLLALMLRRRYFDHAIGTRFAYATLGLLFVNVSIGGVLTHFAAPPVLMVASKWGWDFPFMLAHFGWRAAVACVVSTAGTVWVFRRELSAVPDDGPASAPIPAWLTGLHVAFLAAVVLLGHHPDVFLGAFVLFLGVVHATRGHQDPLKLKEGLMVGFFLAGLVTLGSFQDYWLKPLIQKLDGTALFFGATGLTAFVDNAALTYLGTLVDGLSDRLKYALVAGAVTGGGLTVIANAPNPAGIGILQGARVFGGDGISPLRLFLGAIAPTAIAVLVFWAIPGPR